MDGSFGEKGVLNELQVLALQITTWNEIRIQVRAWASKHQFLACQTTPVTDGLQIAYQDSAEECQTVLVNLPGDVMRLFIKEYEATSGVW